MSAAQESDKPGYSARSGQDNGRCKREKVGRRVEHATNRKEQGQTQSLNRSKRTGTASRKTRERPRETPIATEERAKRQEERQLRNVSINLTDQTRAGEIKATETCELVSQPQISWEREKRSKRTGESKEAERKEGKQRQNRRQRAILCTEKRERKKDKPHRKRRERAGGRGDGPWQKQRQREDRIVLEKGRKQKETKQLLDRARTTDECGRASIRTALFSTVVCTPRMGQRRAKGEAGEIFRKGFREVPKIGEIGKGGAWTKQQGERERQRTEQSINRKSRISTKN